MHKAEEQGLRVLALVTDAYGGMGGIAQYNRDVLGALCSFDEVETVVCLPRLATPPFGETPAKLVHDTGGLGGKARYVTNVISSALKGGRVDLVYCAHLNLLPIARMVSTLKRAPLVLAIYGVEAWAPPGGLTRKLVADVDLVTSISEVTRDRFLSWAPIGRDLVAITPNAINLQDYGEGEKSPELVKRYGLAGKRVLMTLGRMDPAERYKGFDEIISVLPKLDEDIVYIAAGDGGDRPRLETLARAAGLADRVIFTGRIDEETKRELYRLTDAYVMPSSGEGFGFVVLEALASGTPVMASRTDGTREAARDGLLGVLVDPQDRQEVKAGILKTLQAPRGIPEGLKYFDYANFAARLKATLGRVAPMGGAS